MIRPLLRLLAALVLALALAASSPALAEVRIHFHSFNGTLFGRWPHAFIVLEGTLQSTGQVVDDNFGFSALNPGPSALLGPVAHTILYESAETIATTNRHFSLTITDEQYHLIIAEVRAWANAPGRFYDLERRNCIHFVGRMAQLLGLRVDYPPRLLRRPRAWLNHITTLNPELNAAPLR